MNPQEWSPISTINDLTRDEIYDGAFLMYSKRDGIQIVSHGWFNDNMEYVWIYADGMTMKNPTHWMYLPNKPLSAGTVILQP